MSNDKNTTQKRNLLQFVCSMFSAHEAEVSTNWMDRQYGVLLKTAGTEDFCTLHICASCGGSAPTGPEIWEVYPATICPFCPFSRALSFLPSACVALVWYALSFGLLDSTILTPPKMLTTDSEIPMRPAIYSWGQYVLRFRSGIHQFITNIILTNSFD